MKHPGLALLALLTFAAFAACATPTPTPTPQPPTPTPTSTPTPAPTPTPTPTPTPRPTPTPTATPTPAPTPTPTPLPTPTPTPTLQDALAKAEPAMVRLSVSGKQWTGVMIDAKGLILTTAKNLGPAPIASFATPGGQSGQAWVLGRDDGRDVALLEVISPAATYPALTVSTASVPALDLDMVTMQYGSSGTALDRRVARIVGVRQDLNTGIRYVQLQALVTAGAEGGALVDNGAELRGLRMTEEQMTALGLGRAGEVYVMASDALKNSVLPQLRAGILIIISRPPASGAEPGAPPPIPAIFSGTITIGGSAPQAETRIYAKVSKAGLADIWFSQPLGTTGLYIMPIGLTEQGYGGASVEFWALAKKATQTVVYQPGTGATLNLTFP